MVPFYDPQPCNYHARAGADLDVFVPVCVHPSCCIQNCLKLRMKVSEQQFRNTQFISFNAGQFSMSSSLKLELNICFLFRYFFNSRLVIITTKPPDLLCSKQMHGIKRCKLCSWGGGCRIDDKCSLMNIPSVLQTIRRIRFSATKLNLMYALSSSCNYNTCTIMQTDDGACETGTFLCFYGTMCVFN